MKNYFDGFTKPIQLLEIWNSLFATNMKASSIPKSSSYIILFIDFFWINASYMFQDVFHETKTKSLFAMIPMIHISFWGEITSNKVIDSFPFFKDYATRSKKFAFFAWSLKFHFQLFLWLAAFWNCFWVFCFKMFCNIKTMKSCLKRIVSKFQFDIS